MNSESRQLKLLADAVTLASLLCLVGWLVFYALNGFTEADALAYATNTLSYLVFAAVGLLIVQRQPHNPIGWVCALIGFFALFLLFADAYLDYAYVTGDRDVPLKAVAPVVPQMFWVVPTLAPPLLLPALFPDGKPLSQRWGYALRFGVVMLLGIALLSAVSEDESNTGPNPLAIEALQSLTNTLGPVFLVGWSLAFIASVASAVQRFRRSHGQTRLQMKWFAYATAVAGVLAFANDYVDTSDQGNFLLGVGLSLVACSIGVSVLRYRLYEIDRLVTRTLTYGLLTALLAALYFGLVVALQAVLASIANDSSYAVALTTLVVAGLFFPIRQRVQSLVDRRFNRRTYDAAKTIDAFALRLREEIELDTLRYELLAVVDETMQPVSASVWLRGGQ